MAYSASDYLNAIFALCPRGKLWNKTAGSNLAKTLALFTPALERLDARAEFMLFDVFPATAYESLDQWELTLGLPDPCRDGLGTVAQRQQDVVSRLADAGGESIAAIESYLATLGFIVTIQEFTPFRAGIGLAGDPLYGVAFANAWTVTAPLETVDPFRAGSGRAGEPLATWGNAVLECAVDELKPSHTIVNFIYQ